MFISYLQNWQIVCSLNFQLFSNGFLAELIYFVQPFRLHNHTPWSGTLSHHLIVYMAIETIRHIGFIYIFWNMWNIFNVQRSTYMLMHLSSMKRQFSDTIELKQQQKKL